MGSVSPTSILFRVERQTLRRLPQTRAIVFSIRTYLIPLPELVREPDVPERLASAIRGWGSDIWEYVIVHIVVGRWKDLCSNIKGTKRAIYTARSCSGTWTNWQRFLRRNRSVGPGHLYVCFSAQPA
jgi:hypothetical protein